jgi:methionyl-tRNA synthetase
VGCEAFKTDKELIDKHCPLHPPEKTVWKSEENWFFRLSKYVPQIIELIEDPKTNYIFPEGKRQEVLAKLKAGVKDISISREKVKWGVPVPWDPIHTIYVWIDALINYYSATQFVENKSGFWPADLHLLGKEILWFHTVIWQAMLLSAKLALPKRTYTHSFYTIDGQKMSKSLGNTIPPKELVELFGADAARYLIISSFPNQNDTDIGIGKFTEKYNADLANNWGNLVSRVTKLAQGLEFPQKDVKPIEGFETLLENCQFDEALAKVFSIVDEANVKLNTKTPWKLDKNDPTRTEILGDITNDIRQAAHYLRPIMPESSLAIEKLFKGNIRPVEKPLFPRIVAEEKKAAVVGVNKNEGVIIGKIIKLEKHPNADKLRVATVDVGQEKSLTIVCGASNIEEGNLVPVAIPGSRVIAPKGGEMEIRETELRGIKSEGMLASALELGVGTDHTGIFLLPSELEKELGKPFNQFIKQ